MSRCLPDDPPDPWIPGDLVIVYCDSSKTYTDTLSDLVSPELATKHLAATQSLPYQQDRGENWNGKS